MKIVIAPQGFKGNLSALLVGKAIEAGIKRAFPDTITVLKPMADGGEGTVQALVDATGGQIKVTKVTGPLGKTHVMARWGILGDGVTAIIETATVSGLTLIPHHNRNPLTTTSYGTGELIREALNRGYRELIIGLGGSATNDGGAGMAQALGVRFLNNRGQSIPFGGAALANLDCIDTTNFDRRLVCSDIIAACDVTNPLCGPEGASCIYALQKGATPKMVAELDAALSHFADIIQKETGENVRNIPGTGAAGGLGMALMFFLKAKLKSGINIVIHYSGLVEEVKDADYVFTAEGRIDNQTAYGKVPAGIADIAKIFNVPVVVIAGEIVDGYQTVYEHGIDAVLSIAPGPITLKQSMKKAEQLLANTAENAMRLISSAKHPKQLRRNNAKT
jgi:glycerate kinase